MRQEPCPTSPSRTTAANRRALLATLAGLGLVAGAMPALAVNAEHGARTVSTNPADNTPHAMNGSVNAITQIGNKVVVAGTFTSVSPANSFSNTADDVVRNRIFAFDATTGAIDPGFNPDVGGAVNSLDNDGTSIYAGGSFTSVGGNTAIKRVVKLTAAGAVAPAFKAVPSSAVSEVVVRGSRLYVGGSFTSVKSGTVTTARGALAALDPGTGAVLAEVAVPFTGIYDPAIGGVTGIKRFDVSADGSRLAAIGNFSTVGGQSRSQLAVLDTSGSAAVAPWSTNRFDADHNDCASIYETFMRDVDISPDGSYFAVTTTGAYAGGASSGTLCDTTTRWETGSTGNDPSWTDYNGGDTTYGVAITGGAIYVGGHMRWQNNPFQGDNAGPGAVPREGIAALDPVNGLPLTWNPGRSRGVGAQALYATPTGLWVGSDTTRIGRETHGRIAFMPLAGGRTVPTVAPAPLPGTLFLAQRPAPGADGVRYRVNATGPALRATDNGGDWSTDSGFLRSGGNPADFGSGNAVDGSVPASTPAAIFNTERWGETSWDFPATAGDALTVRLFFANRCDCTRSAGNRTFDVLIDGATKLDDYDIVADVGHNVGTMKSFPITADADGVDIDLRAVVQSPLINGIEIVTTGGAPTPSAAGQLLKRAVDGSGSPTGTATTANTSFDWSSVRGAFFLNGTVYYGLPDGGLHARTYNTATGAAGVQRTINLYDDPETGQRIPFVIANLTGMFYDTTTHRLYYTLFGDAKLYYRYFTPESEVVGAETFVGDNGGVDLGAVAGMTLAGGKVLYGSSADGSLRSAPFAGGRISGAAGSVSTDGTWNYRAIFAPNS